MEYDDETRVKIRISQGNEDSGSRINEADRIRDHEDSDADVRVNLQQQRPRDVDIPRRSQETESRFWHRQRVKKLTSLSTVSMLCLILTFSFFF